MPVTAIQAQERALRVHWADGSESELPWIWLRDNDVAELHPHTGERTFDLTSVPIDLQPQDCRLEADGIAIQWPGREDTSRYTHDWLQSHRPGQTRPDPAAVQREFWHANNGEPARVDGQACLADPQALCRALQLAKQRGLVVIEGLADSADAGETFGDLIGFKRETNFGVTFEVINKPDPNNLAYTALGLPLHTDLPNQELIPGYQFLHCYRNTATGGASVFADGFSVCDDLRREAPAHFELLSQVAVPWRFHDETADLRSRRPVIVLDENQQQEMLVFNAHIADIPDLPADTLYDFYAAYQDLMKRLREPRYAVHYRLNPGEMVMFDNRRVLHGREAFDPDSGIRHYRGYYIEHNEVNSRIRLLHR